MKTIVLISTLGLISASPLMALDTNVLTDDKARLSYSIGVTFARQWKEQGVDVDPDVVLRGLKDEQEGMPLLMNQEELSATMTKVQQGIAARTQLRLAQIKEMSEAFLATNKNNPGVISLPDGLQYKIITEGDGAIPADGDTVSLNFRGTFVDGSEFASGKSTPVPVGRNAIHGWDEALKLMKTGSKWQVFIPSELAYGQTGFASHIPPNAALDSRCGAAVHSASRSASPSASPAHSRAATGAARSAAHQRHHCRPFRRGLETRQAALHHQGGGRSENPAGIAAHQLTAFI